MLTPSKKEEAKIDMKNTNSGKDLIFLSIKKTSPKNYEKKGKGN
jgi:hypothetical protein